jgi:preprotein translocase subunit SecG
MLKTAALVAQIVISALLIVLILLQAKGTGFGRVWGSTSSFSRRGLEKLVFRFTFVVVAVFVAVALLQFLV